MIRPDPLPPRLTMDEYADFIARNPCLHDRERVDRQKAIEERVTTPFRMPANGLPVRQLTPEALAKPMALNGKRAVPARSDAAGRRIDDSANNVFPGSAKASQSFDYEAARRFLDTRRRERAAARRALWEKAVTETDAIIAMIREKYQPIRILQWGSVLYPEHFSEASDIDIAVEGVDAIPFMRLCADAEQLSGFPLHIVRWEALEPEFRNIIAMKGRVAYEKP